MKNYNIGLDIGTTSVGWAVVEEDTQKVIKKGGKRLWGVRLFEEAHVAADRRMKRSTRRGYDRRRERIRLLQEEFREEILKVDPNFFTKLKESFYNELDVENKTIKISSVEKNLIKEYHQKFPTIYHLRDRLVHDTSKMDIRLVYLAIHHIVKYRGNFLYHTENFNVEHLDIEKNLSVLFENLLPILDISLEPDYSMLASAISISSKNDRKLAISECLSGFPKTFVNEFIKVFNGGKFDFVKMLALSMEDAKVKLTFNGSDYEDSYEELEKVLGEYIEILELLRELYDMFFLKSLFRNSEHTNLSSLMVSKYDTHQKDLKFLKHIFCYDEAIYSKFFKTKKQLCIYEKYVHNHMTNDEFCREIKKYLPDVFEKVECSSLIDEYTNSVCIRMDNGEFMPRITDGDNSKYPYQLNKYELIKIIENQGKYYPFLLNKTEDHVEKIVKLLSFRIPYYVGPLVSKEQSQFAWMIRKDSGKITPYNFDQMIDKEKTAEEFIKRMISHCTYLLNEFAMPACSILYSKYKVMNELKQIKVNNEGLTNDFQHKVLNQLFMKRSGAITDKVFKEYLYQSREFDMYGTDLTVTGYSADLKFASNMQSYYDFFGDGGIFEGTSYQEEEAEQIIECITIFEDKEILEKKVKTNYPELTTEKVGQIVRKKYKGWGSLSRKLLIEKYYVDPTCGTKKSIFDLMYETKKNFMQILNEDQYQFQKMIDDYNQVDSNQKITYALVENLATAPSIKRGIYQSLLVVEELVKYMGKDPSSIVIEMARSHESKVRTNDRKKYLTQLYENSKEGIEHYNELMAELQKVEQIDDRLYLYFMQWGKSLYSQTPLSIENLGEYEIDHIIPRTLIKDDSLDNKVLVLKEENKNKAASFVVPACYRNSVNQKWWEQLKKMGFLSFKKLHRLSRKYYTDQDIEGFINRQIVETRQITKHVANILNHYYPSTKMIYLKSKLLHDYRKRYQLFKFREINNYHHAHDAYLAAVLGEYKEKHLCRKIDYDIVKTLNAKLFASKDYERLNFGFVINSLDSSFNQVLLPLTKNVVDVKTGEILLDVDEFHKRVENTLYCNDILISKKVEFRTGEFYQQTKNAKGMSGVSLKKNLSTKLYGSYTSLHPAYAILVRYTHKGKEEQRLLGLPIYFLEQSKTDTSAISDYVRRTLKLTDHDTFSIQKERIPFYSLLNWEGQICYLVGASDKVEVCNAKEFYFDREFMKKYKTTLEKLYHQHRLEVEDYDSNLESVICYIVDKMEKEYKLYENLIVQLKHIVCYDHLVDLSLEEKEKIIIELLRLLKCDSANANFKFLDSSYSSAFGKKNSRIISSAIIKYHSVTGIRGRHYEF